MEPNLDRVHRFARLLLRTTRFVTPTATVPAGVALTAYLVGNKFWFEIPAVIACACFLYGAAGVLGVEALQSYIRRRDVEREMNGVDRRRPV
jgi:hypothetical protein